MLRFQDALPQLPVPDLAETCALYLQLVHPLVSDGEYAATQRAVTEFAQPGGRGEELQRRLVHWSEASAPENWLDPFWDDWYLCDDSPLVVNVSPGFALRGGCRPQLVRAGALLAAATRVRKLIASEALEPDFDGDSPRCMREYGRLFGSTRVPGAVRDRLERHPDARQVVVVHRERFFALDAVDEHGRPYGRNALQRALRRIVENAEPGDPSLGVLTADRRRSWAAVRDQHLARGPAPTRELLDAVERAILVLVLDESVAPPGARTGEAARLFLHGDARNRWFDKSIQLIVASSGAAGFCMEHSGFDGSTAVRLAELLVEHEADAAGADGEPAVRRLGYERTAPLDDEIRRAGEDADALVARTDLDVVSLDGLGKHRIVGHAVSPDGFVQMAFQLASFTLTGETASTYEAVDTKRFLHGRTEAMRSVSDESVAFVRALRGARRSSPYGVQLLRAAIERHVARVARCKDGRGVDRHLLGLRKMVRDEETLPELFEDTSYPTLTRSVLSTSALPSSPGVALSGFGPVVNEGLGLSYTVHDDSFCCVVTSFRGQAKAFASELTRSVEEMDALLAGDGA
jgi:carnitine O-acetyltransferase